MDKILAVDGIVKCARNAEDLIASAQVLFRKNRPVGTALLTTAIEEYGKANLIFFHAVGVFPENIFKQSFRSHSFKRGFATVAALMAVLTVDGKKDAQKFRRTVALLNFDAIRDSALYVDYHEGLFVSPKLDVKNFVRVFRLALRLKRSFAVFANENTCRELMNKDWEKLFIIPSREGDDYVNDFDEVLAGDKAWLRRRWSSNLAKSHGRHAAK